MIINRVFGDVELRRDFFASLPLSEKVNDFFFSMGKLGVNIADEGALRVVAVEMMLFAVASIQNGHHGCMEIAGQMINFTV